MYSHQDVKLYARFWCNFETMSLVYVIARKLGGRFRIDVIEIPVTEFILWNMHTVRDLLCFVTVKWKIAIWGWQTPQLPRPERP